ncbi:hypothetical protein SAMN05660649_04299 [Desulfotomaculum arcticum]|uniref:Uncharacterized protein n=1 Tax=Desulfotruncus arcticus DSM 17038 TaxID=1121424 RepID=A0A1I2Y898_9FIRM|nr:hypothetical protein [Desulfotruncus arcticus]SFH21852.1 hypothetical protein SAMN05660649_04299 [Desulfotomaculum arcticum] [Desulfotruncus arcticus DSM 17038]
MNTEVFLSELTAMNQKLGRDESNLSAEDKANFLKKQLSEYRQKEKLIQNDIKREIDDFFAWANMKKAGIEALNSMREYLRLEISRMEDLINGGPEIVQQKLSQTEKV